jgi:hypothetical protein
MIVMTRSSKNTPKTAVATAAPENMDERMMGQPLSIGGNSNSLNKAVIHNSAQNGTKHG